METAASRKCLYDALIGAQSRGQRLLLHKVSSQMCKSPARSTPITMVRPQRYWRPRTDQWGATSIKTLAVAGDDAGISVRSAALAGKLAALRRFTARARLMNCSAMSKPVP